LDLSPERVSGIVEKEGKGGTENYSTVPEYKSGEGYQEGNVWPKQGY